MIEARRVAVVLLGCGLAVGVEAGGTTLTRVVSGFAGRLLTGDASAQGVLYSKPRW